MAPKEAFRLEFSYTCCAAEFNPHARCFNLPATATALGFVLFYENEGYP